MAVNLNYGHVRIQESSTRASEIRTLVESAADSNVLTDADHTKLNAIENSATADQTKEEIRAAVEAAFNSNVLTNGQVSAIAANTAKVGYTEAAVSSNMM